MWYELLLKKLFISKVSESEQDAASEFIDTFFQCYHPAAQEKLSPQIILGLISKFHKKYDSIENNTVTLQQLSRELIGVSIILMKASFDDRVFNDDFKFDNSVIKSALGLASSNNTNGNNVRRKHMFDEWDGWGEQFPDDIHKMPTFSGQICFLEAEAFKALDYNLSIDFEYVLSVLVKNRWDVSPELFEYYKDSSTQNNKAEYYCFSGQSDVFDEFLYKLTLRLMAHQYIEKGDLQGLQEFLNGDPNKIAEITHWWRSLFRSSICITPDFISKNIQDLSTLENSGAFLIKAPKSNQLVKADFLHADPVLMEPPIVTQRQSFLARIGIFSQAKINMKTSASLQESLSFYV